VGVTEGRLCCTDTVDKVHLRMQLRHLMTVCRTLANLQPASAWVEGVGGGQVVGGAGGAGGGVGGGAGRGTGVVLQMTDIPHSQCSSSGTLKAD
jgi:hypothetical protein